MFFYDVFDYEDSNKAIFLLARLLFKQFKALFTITEGLSSKQYFAIKTNLCSNYRPYITFKRRDFLTTQFFKTRF